MMRRTVILLLDSFGIGGAEDACQFKDVTKEGRPFNDDGANTLGNIAAFCAAGLAEEGRTGPLQLPNLNRLGLGFAAKESCGGCYPEGLDENVVPEGAYGYASEVSTGKDTSSGHWEMMGAPVTFKWGYFRKKSGSFPPELIEVFVREAKIPGILGNCQASGTEIIKKHGMEHIKTGKPIVYTSADSVFQIAAHEEHFGLERLYEICEIARKLVDRYNVARVIARPFVGESPETFQRTGNRHDYSVKPPAKTLLDEMKESGNEVVSVGKIKDIFAGCGITRAYRANGVEELFDTTLAAVKELDREGLVFTNFVNFDADYGHRRNISGYARELEYFDRRLPEMMAQLGEEDLLVVTADHGCDPTWWGTDHTREHIPVLFYGKRVRPVNLGHRYTFADIGQTIAEHHGLKPLLVGKSFYHLMLRKP
ncbi:phosphopentomutase [Hydrogenimonas sp. SS33]|uniref:phosphopentomutase n=1 Tax=Hydrogenimonas leucolamina TaxID=2954236 RepID=UPI00336BBE2F